MSNKGQSPEDRRTMPERMLAGDLYIADDPQIFEALRRAVSLMHKFNTGDPTDDKTQTATLRELFGSLGDDVWIRPPLYVDYGSNITIGARTFINYNAVLLDVAKITIGEDVQIAPNVQILTPSHPLDPELRRAKWESAQPITIGNNVWLGGGAIILPGVTIGENTVVGAGSVVTRSLPANVVAVGNPARIIRNLVAGE